MATVTVQYSAKGWNHRTAVAVSQQDDTLQRALRSCVFRTPPLKMWDLLTNSTLLQLIYLIVFSCVVWLLLSRKLSSIHGPSPRSVAILVLGDVGRSPRMMYHAESFAKLQFETFLVGYKGTCALRMPSIGALPVDLPQAPNRYRPCSLSLTSTFCIFRNHRSSSKSCRSW